MANLHWDTVHPMLRKVLGDLMGVEMFAPFRLVGGTALALQLGHRQSVDIDLFTEEVYGSIDFDAIDSFLRKHYLYVSSPVVNLVGFGKSYFVGEKEYEAIKLDVYYTEPFIRPAIVEDSTRMANLEDIIAMKIDVIQRGGRKKDFWDIHEILDRYSLTEMIAFHSERYPYGHDSGRIRQNMTDFSTADDDLEPICLRGKHWEIIRAELAEAVSKDSE